MLPSQNPILCHLKQARHRRRKRCGRAFVGLRAKQVRESVTRCFGSNMRVVYIVGASHSGSSLLNMILNAHPDIIWVGEVLKLNEIKMTATRIW